MNDFTSNDKRFLSDSVWTDVEYWDDRYRSLTRRAVLLGRFASVSAVSSLIATVFGSSVLSFCGLAAAVGCAVASYRASVDADAAMTFRDWTLQGLGVGLTGPAVTDEDVRWLNAMALHPACGKAAA